MAKAHYRLFFAVELSPELKTRLLNLQHAFSDLDARPVPADNFHITLNFLGEVAERQLEAILDHFSPIAMQPFDVSLGSLLFWPKPKIIATAIEDPQQKLLVCKKMIDQQLSQIDFFQSEKRKYVPHITLFRDVERPPKEMFSIDAVVPVNAVSLMVSQSARNGVTYRTIEQWPLDDGDIRRQLIGTNSK